MASGGDFGRIWATEAVGDDVGCAGWGYNLRSLKQGAMCPECGEAVTMSLIKFHFRATHTPTELEVEWVGRLREGALLILAALSLAIVNPLAMGSRGHPLERAVSGGQFSLQCA